MLTNRTQKSGIPRLNCSLELCHGRAERIGASQLRDHRRERSFLVFSHPCPHLLFLFYFFPPPIRSGSILTCHRKLTGLATACAGRITDGRLARCCLLSKCFKRCFAVTDGRSHSSEVGNICLQNGSLKPAVCHLIWLLIRSRLPDGMVPAHPRCLKKPMFFCCCSAIVVVLFFVLPSLFYFNGELRRFLHRG